MALFLRNFTFVVFFQAFLVNSFLMNTNTSQNLHSSGQATGSDADILYLLQKIDNLQLQIHQQTRTMEELNKTLETQSRRMETQSKIMEAQNKTLEAQSKIIKEQNKTIQAQSKSMEAQNQTLEAQSKTQEAQKIVIQELLNFTRQTPSTVSLSNDLSVLEMHVRRMMDEYQTLSNISNTTNLEISTMANSVRALTLHLTTQENKVNQMDHDFTQHVNTLNGSILSVSDTTDLKINKMAKSVSALTLRLTTQENKVNLMDHDIAQHVNTLNGSLLSVSNRVSQNERDTSSHFSSISSSLSRLNTDMTVIETRVGFTVGVTSPSSSWRGDILVFPHVITNIGNSYSNTTGKFTAPRAGSYVFFVTNVSGYNYGLSLSIVYNGAGKVTTYSTGSAHYQTGTNLAVLELRQGDTAWVRCDSGTGYYTSPVPLTTFSGFLL